MIYLITGVLGTGKTAMVVNMILDNYEGLFKYKADDGTEIDRPLYFCHIDSLDRRKFKAHELTEEQIQEKCLHEIVPNGSVVIVDEADYTYPVRSASREVPMYIKRLKEIRHDGITLILMTQHPSMIDRYIRNLVGKHIHLERKQVGTKRYEWLRCEESLNSASFSQATSTFYKPDEKAFKYYKSAEMHIGFQKKKHWAFYALPLLILLVAWAVWTSVSRFTPKQPDSNQVIQGQQQIQQPIIPDSYNIDLKKDSVSSASEPMGSKIQHYVPKIADLPETKPIYDDVRKVVNMETVSACVKSDKSCNCYTNQGTLLNVSDYSCQMYIKNGIFDRYRQRS